MTEPTGIPLLDRLDALQQDIDIDDWYCELDIAYPDLRVLVLQYREERDRAIEERDDAREARDQFHSSGLVKMQHELQARRERDALVEALKAIRDEKYPATECPDCSHPVNEHSLRPNGPCLAWRGGVGLVDCGCRLGSAQALARAALPDEEARDE